MEPRAELKQEITRQKAIVKETLEAFQDSCKEIQLLAIEYVNKWLISNRIQQEKASNKATSGNSQAKPTFKQINYAKELCIENPEQYSRSELSKKIEEAKNKL